MMEITLCATHARYNCADCRTFADSIKGDPDFRACADCNLYHLVKDMITKSDGRIICPGCQKAIDAKSRERAQENLFVTQPALF